MTPPPTKFPPLPQQYDPPSKVKFLDIPAKTFPKFLTPPQVGLGGGGTCHACVKGCAGNYVGKTKKIFYEHEYVEHEWSDQNSIMKSQSVC